MSKLSVVSTDSGIDVDETLLRFEEAKALCILMSVTDDGFEEERVHLCRAAGRLIEEGLADTRQLLGRDKQD
jgi:hypothetical protein